MRSDQSMPTSRSTATANGLTPLGVGPGRLDLEVAAAEVLQQRLADLAAGGVAGAHEEHPDGMVGHGLLLRGGADASGGLDGQLEVGQLRIEAVEVIALAGDGGALLVR